MHEYWLAMHDLPRCMNINSRCMIFRGALILTRNAWSSVMHEYWLPMHDLSRCMNIDSRCMIFHDAWILTRDAWSSPMHEYWFAMHGSSTMHEYWLVMHELLQCVNIDSWCMSIDSWCMIFHDPQILTRDAWSSVIHEYWLSMLSLEPNEDSASIKQHSDLLGAF